jgi:radical SAM superfamily enzyme YgiQ (UPF0313 family)
MVEDQHEVLILDCPTVRCDFECVESYLQRIEPDMIGLTSTTSTIYQAYRVIRLAKRLLPKIVTVLGGPHSTFMAREVLMECQDLDIVIYGEGEVAFKRLVEDWPNLSRVPNIVYRQENEILENPEKDFINDLDQLLFPAYHLLPMESYEHEGKRFGAIMTSRGCPFNCIFCSSSLLWGKRWRARTPKNVLQELELLSKKFRVNEIEFLDDLFTFDQNRAEQICDLIKERCTSISYVCSSRVNTFSERLAKKLKASGCHTVYFGAESAVPRILSFLRKGISPSKTIEAVEIAKKVGLNTIVSFILGTPGETEQDIKKTIEFAKKLKPNYAQFTIYTPFPGTKAFELAREEGTLLTNDWSRYTTQQPVQKLDHVSPKKLTNLLRRAYLEFYLNPRFISNALRNGKFTFLLKSLGRGLLWIYQNDRVFHIFTRFASHYRA